MSTKENTLSNDELSKVNGSRADHVPTLTVFERARLGLPISIEPTTQPVNPFTLNKGSDRGVAGGV